MISAEMGETHLTKKGISFSGMGDKESGTAQKVVLYPTHKIKYMKIRTRITKE